MGLLRLLNYKWGQRMKLGVRNKVLGVRGNRFMGGEK